MWVFPGLIKAVGFQLAFTWAVASLRTQVSVTWLDSSDLLRALGVGREGWLRSQLDEANLRLEPRALCLPASRVTGEGGVQTARAAGQVPELVGGVSTGKQAEPLIF